MDFLRNQLEPDEAPKGTVTEVASLDIAKSADVEMLKAELAEAMREKNALRLMLDEKSIGEEGSMEPCFFLKKLPIEVRNMIYGLLLTNGLLSSARTCNRPDLPGFTHVDKYGLSPAILRACRQINEEASTILYGLNVFIIDFVDEHFAVSPVTREFCNHDRLGHPGGHHGESHWTWRRTTELRECAAFNKVKNWKVILSANIDESPIAPHVRFVYFCRAICDKPLQSLKVLILPRGEEFNSRPAPYPWGHRANNYHALSKIVSPLKMLRNVGDFQLAEAEGDDVGVYQPLLDRTTLPWHDLNAGFNTKLNVLVESDEPVQHLFKMLQNLVAYAQSFERCEQHRQDMNPKYSYARCLLSGQHDAEMNENPFMQCPIHPVEEGLLLASKACDDDDVEAFKSARKLVIEYLEPQYQRITLAATLTAVLVKKRKKPGYLFDPNLSSLGVKCPYNTDYPSLTLLLEDYATSFNRDMPPMTRYHIRRCQRKFNLCYSTLPREVRLKQISDCLEDQYSGTGDDFVRWFKAAMDDMDSQYLQIRASRKAIFHHDTGKWGCDLDLELWRCDEMVEWSVNEPDIQPKRLPPSPEVNEYGNPIGDTDEDTDVDDVMEDDPSDTSGETTSSMSESEADEDSWETYSEVTQASALMIPTLLPIRGDAGHDAVEDTSSEGTSSEGTEAGAQVDGSEDEVETVTTDVESVWEGLPDSEEDETS